MPQPNHFRSPPWLRGSLGAVLVLAALIALAALAGVGPRSVTPAQAQYGTNDNFDSSTEVSSLPFSDVVNTAGTSTEPGEPQACVFMNETVWYRFTASSEQRIRVDSAGTPFAANLNVYQSFGGGLGNLGWLGCAQTGSPMLFTAQAGTTYYVQGGILFGATGDLHVNLEVVPPPANDDFANATGVGSLPFDDTVDTNAATNQAGEPTPSCGFGTPSGTVWYAFTPASSGSVTARVNAGFSTVVAAYTGSSLASLSDLGCRPFGNQLTVHVNAGQTYYFQAAGIFGQRGTLAFHLDVSPPPQASFFTSLSDPSMFENIQFIDQSSDPVGVGIDSQAWSFGDGGTATGCCPIHRYTSDGDYTTRLTVTTFDQRTASTTRVIHVKTHDVAITKIAAPSSGSTGQTRQVTVSVLDNRYPETVQVTLLKSVPGGFEQVGVLTQSILPRGKTHAVPFTFNYTFTANDATIGKVTFKAIATIVGARDALPADNEAIAAPTKVSR